MQNTSTCCINHKYNKVFRITDFSCHFSFGWPLLQLHHKGSYGKCYALPFSVGLELDLPFVRTNILSASEVLTAVAVEECEEAETCSVWLSSVSHRLSGYMGTSSGSASVKGEALFHL